jgi:very-short-patch-repair endonuclease
MRTTPAAVFSRAEARDHGWSDSALDRAVRAGRVYRLRRGLFTSCEQSQHALLAAVAAARACTGSVISHRSAARVHGLPLLSYPVRPELTVGPSGTCDVSGALLHRATLLSGDVVERMDVRVTAAARTLVDVARSATTAGAVVALDAALHRELTSPEALSRVLVDCWTWPGIRRAVRAIDLADGCAESPLESISRIVLGRLRLPAAQLQARLHDEIGMFVARVDFYWPEHGVVGEADGKIKYETRDDLLEEKRRQEALEELGLVVVRWDWADVTRRPHLLRERIEAAFERGRRRDRSGLPRLWSVRVA